PAGCSPGASTWRATGQGRAARASLRFRPDFSTRRRARKSLHAATTARAASRSTARGNAGWSQPGGRKGRKPMHRFGRWRTLPLAGALALVFVPAAFAALPRLPDQARVIDTPEEEEEFQEYLTETQIVVQKRQLEEQLTLAGVDPDFDPTVLALQAQIVGA